MLARPLAAIRISLLPRLLRALVVLLCSIAPIGCSLLSVNLKQPEVNCNLLERNTQACSVDDALNYTAQWRDTHLKAAGQHSVARNLNALVAFPAGAVGAFYAISGHGSTDRISRLALGSATVYGTTSFLAPQGKQRAYLEGALALSCVMDASLNVRRTPEDVKQLKDSVSEVRKQHASLEATLSAHSNDLKDNAPVLARAAVARDNALNLLVRANETLNLHENAGYRIAFATDRIVNQTALLASRHESNLESLLAAAGALRGTAGSFGLAGLPSAPAVDPKRIAQHSAGQGDAAEARAAEAEKAIRSTTDALIKEMALLLFVVRSMEVPASDAQAYKLCALNDVAVDFSVLPAEAAQSIKEGESLDFQIKNTQSNAFPSFSKTGAKADSIEVSGPTIKNGKLVIVVKGAKATGGEAIELTIMDPSGDVSKSYAITVLPAEAAAPPGEKKAPVPKTVNDASAPPAGFTGSFTTDEIKRFQCRLGLTGKDSDGVLGTTTYRELVKFAGARSMAVGPKLSQKLFDEVMKQTDMCEGTT